MRNAYLFLRITHYAKRQTSVQTTRTMGRKRLEAGDGEVGKVGVAINSIRDMETLLADIPLDKVSASMTVNATASILLALYIAAARKRGIGERGLSGTVQNDILKEYIARGTYIFPVP